MQLLPIGFSCLNLMNYFTFERCNIMNKCTYCFFFVFSKYNEIFGLNGKIKFNVLDPVIVINNISSLPGLKKLEKFALEPFVENENPEIFSYLVSRFDVK